MQEKWKTEWIKALRSGAYTQIKGALSKGGGGLRGYCCLGVLAHLQGASFQASGAARLGVRWSKGQLSDHMACGLTMEEQDMLVDMNDDGVPFEKIADYIEKNIKGE